VRPGWGCDHPRGLYIVSNWLGAMRRHQVVYIVRKRVSGETLGCAYALLPRQMCDVAARAVVQHFADLLYGDILSLFKKTFWSKLTALVKKESKEQRRLCLWSLRAVERDHLPCVLSRK